MTGQADTTVLLKITPLSDYFAAGDPRTDDEALELDQALQRELPDDVKPRSEPGQKGIVTDVIIPLGSSGALTATVEVFKAWLAKRPTNRKLVVEFEVEEDEDGRRSGRLEVDATNVDDSVLDSVVKESL